MDKMKMELLLLRVLDLGDELSEALKKSSPFRDPGVAAWEKLRAEEANGEFMKTLRQRVLYGPREG